VEQVQLSPHRVNNVIFLITKKRLVQPLITMQLVVVQELDNLLVEPLISVQPTFPPLPQKKVR
jgi:hypothetical protein